MRRRIAAIALSSLCTAVQAEAYSNDPIATLHIVSSLTKGNLLELKFIENKTCLKSGSGFVNPEQRSSNFSLVTTYQLSRVNNNCPFLAGSYIRYDRNDKSPASAAMTLQLDTKNTCITAKLVSNEFPNLKKVSGTHPHSYSLEGEYIGVTRNSFSFLAADPPETCIVSVIFDVN